MFPYLIEIGARFRLTGSIEVVDVDKLEVVAQTSVRGAILRQAGHVAQVAQSQVSPPV